MEYVLDTSGLLCPYPLAKTKRFIKKMKPGDTLKVLSTDSASLIDFKVYAEINHEIELIQQYFDEGNQQYVFVLVKCR